MDMICRGSTKLLRIGIGIHHGVASAGFMGDSHRLNAMLVSSEVNLASRLEGLTKYYGSKILMSDAAASQLNTEVFAIRKLGDVLYKGGEKPLAIHELFQTDDPALQQFKRNTEELFNRAISQQTIFG